MTKRKRSEEEEEEEEYEEEEEEVEEELITLGIGVSSFVRIQNNIPYQFIYCYYQNFVDPTRGEFECDQRQST